MTVLYNEKRSVHGWKAIVRQLSCPSSPPPLQPESRALDTISAASFPIRSVERITPRTATVEWCEPSVCHYAEQTWVHGVAKRDGYCALTGEPIRRGDAVFHPRHVSPPPRNAEAMIAAQRITELPRS